MCVRKKCTYVVLSKRCTASYATMLKLQDPVGNFLASVSCHKAFAVQASLLGRVQWHHGQLVNQYFILGHNAMQTYVSVAVPFAVAWLVKIVVTQVVLLLAY